MSVQCHHDHVVVSTICEIFRNKNWEVKNKTKIEKCIFRIQHEGHDIAWARAKGPVFSFQTFFFCSAIIIFFVLLKIFSFFVCSHKTKFDDANLSRQTDCAICQTSGFLFRRWKGKKFDNNSSRVQRLRKWTQLILAS